MKKEILGYCFLCASLFAIASNSQAQFSRNVISSNLSSAYWVYATDIDGDGDNDLVTASSQGINWWRNNGSGSFSKSFLGSLQNAWGAHAADIDDDGDVDILGCSPATDEIVMWRNNGSESFTRVLVEATNDDDPESVWAADLDGDGDRDIIVALWKAGQIVWYQYNGGNNFTRRTIDGNITGAHAVTAADFDRDGDMDVAGSSAGNVYWYANNGSGGFSRRTINGNGALGLQAVDIDRDGDMDLLRTQRNNGDVDVFRNSGGGGFSEVTIGSGYGDSWSVAGGDIDGDGDIDVAAAGFAANEVTVWYNNGGVNFGPAVKVDDANTVRGVFIANLNGNGKEDIVAAIRDDADLIWYEESGAPPPPPKTITVTDPNGGEVLTVGETFDIRWSSTGSISNVQVEYSTNNGSSWSTIVNSTNNDGVYTWTVPDDPTTQGRVRVSEAGNSSVSDQSNNSFTIEASSKSLTVVDPNGGETLEVGSDFDIRWNSTGSISNVRIEYSTNNGSSWSTVLNITNNDGFYRWTVPNSPTNQGLIRITDVDDGSVQDVSNNGFTISEPPKNITVTDPNGGEDLEVGSSHTIRWSSSGNISNVRIEFSSNNGGSWSNVINSTNNDGLHNWTVPNSPTNQGLIRITDVDDGSVQDVSNNVFTISEPPKNITVTDPNGGEELQVGSDFDIRWSSTGSISNVRIEYSTNNGGSWSTVINSTNNDGLHNWTVPDAPTSQGLIRITDASDATIRDVSDDVFTISEPPKNITVVAPNGGEEIQTGETFDIRWNSSGEIVSVRIEFSDDAGTNWTTVVNSTANDGRHPWTAPDVVTEMGLIRISDAGDPSLNDVSDDVFTISEPPRDITIGAPNGGETLQLQSDYVIQWTSTGDIPEVKIEFSADNGGVWSQVVENTENDGEYEWTLPDITTHAALIRISDASDASVADISDAPFTIDDLLTPPVISDVHATDVTWISARITWATDELSDGQVEYGVGGSSGNLTPLAPGLTTFHSALLTGLQPGTTYDYRVMSRDRYGNLSVSADYQFTTLDSATNDAGFALRFDGVDDFVEVPDAEILSGGPGKSLTVEAWVRLFSLVQDAPIVMKLFDYATKDWGLRINEEGMIQVDIENDGDDWSYEVGEFVLGPWTHVAFTFDNESDTVRIYMNGEEVGEGAAFNLDMPNSDASVLIGRHNYSDVFLDGEIDEVRIWDHARTRLQIQQNMNRSLDGGQAGLLALWKFDEGEGQTAFDASGNELNGQLNGATEGPTWTVSEAPIGGIDVQRFKLSVSSIGPGHIALSPSGGVYDDGLEVIVTAVPDSGAWFYGWFKGIEGKENPITLTMDRDRSLSAAFVRPKRTADLGESASFSKQSGDGLQVPDKVMLLPGYPNPFNPEVKIRFGLPEAGHVKLSVYNIRGQLVRRLLDGQELAGMKEVRWNGTNDSGSPVASGIYIIRMKAEEVLLSRKVTLQR